MVRKNGSGAAVLDKAQETLEGGVLTVTPPNFKVAMAQIIGTSPLMVHRFHAKATLMAKHQAGSRVNKGKTDKAPRDFESEYEAARYRDKKAGWDGFNAASIRGALISACRTAGIKMTQMKLAAFIEADGMDEDGIPLVRIYGEPVMDIRYARNETGVVDLRARPRYDEWHANLRIRFDADMIAFSDLANLLMRAGQQVGIGEGRPDSRKSAGIGYGLFDVLGEVPK
jgi:hypothetical protein